VLGNGGYHVFAGEETAAVAFGPMLRALPSEAHVFGVIEVDEPGDRLPLPRALEWQYRHGRSAAGSQTLLAAFNRLSLPAEPGIAYLAGEARTSGPSGGRAGAWFLCWMRRLRGDGRGHLGRES
jgi:NADPH-dependent ferric siderophore reductase